ncbi:MAG: hypothetical protein K8T90_01020 [Planctomycetes bacterium]|nr:hypothetical protein [Planctomycetota bacterium]
MHARIIPLLLALTLGTAAGCGKAADPAGDVAMCAKHHLLDADCPFCHKDLAAKRGECKEHGVPEALCWVCSPSLVAAYKAEGDWCSEHAVPESRCKQCGK